MCVCGLRVRLVSNHPPFKHLSISAWNHAVEDPAEWSTVHVILCLVQSLLRHLAVRWLTTVQDPGLSVPSIARFYTTISDGHHCRGLAERFPQPVVVLLLLSRVLLLLV